MAYFEGRQVTISSPVLARVTEDALTAWIEKWRIGKDGEVRKVPHELLVFMSELHRLGDETTVSEGLPRHGAKAERKPRSSNRTRPGTIDVMSAAQILGVSPVTVRTYIAKGWLLADRRGRAWMIDAGSVEEMERSA
jgi:Helix-turn-helix domain